MSCGGSLTSCARGAGVQCAQTAGNKEATPLKPKPWPQGPRTMESTLVIVEKGGARRWGHRNPDVLRWRRSRGQPNRWPLLYGAPKDFAWQRFVAIDDTIRAGHASFKRRCQCYVWEADSRPGSGRCAIEGDVETISWFLVIHNRLRAYQDRNKPRSRFVSFHQLQAHNRRIPQKEPRGLDGDGAQAQT